MGVCVSCSSAVADEQMVDDLCPNCAGEPATEEPNQESESTPPQEAPKDSEASSEE